VELQYHPATGRRTVAAVSLGPRGQRVLIFLAGTALLLAISLCWSVPAMLEREARQAQSRSTTESLAAARLDDEGIRARAAALAAREGEWGDELSRIAYLYGVSSARWPRALDPARGVLMRAEAGDAEALRTYLAALETGRSVLAAVEARDPGLPARTPSIVPVSGSSEPAAFFGPRVSPWTGQDEFFCGLDLAAADGTPVVAPAEGRVAFVGRLKRERAPRLWQFGTIVVVIHGAETATLYGHLSRVEVRKGDRVRRGQRLGTVGKTGWALSPRLHYELWRGRAGELSPTDPLFAILDRRFDSRRRSLEQIRATSAPGPQETLPGEK
jgi:murein DD-endopeptidase MepM/ murein hydrolase activator NlpD